LRLTAWARTRASLRLARFPGRTGRLLGLGGPLASFSRAPVGPGGAASSLRGSLTGLGRALAAGLLGLTALALPAPSRFAPLALPPDRFRQRLALHASFGLLAHELTETAQFAMLARGFCFGAEHLTGPGRAASATLGLAPRRLLTHHPQRLAEVGLRHPDLPERVRMPRQVERREQVRHIGAAYFFVGASVSGSKDARDRQRASASQNDSIHHASCVPGGGASRDQPSRRSPLAASIST
jgi:hypothetical protein